MSSCVAALYSCQRSPAESAQPETQPGRVVHFTAGVPETRTAFTSPEGDSYPVLWTSNDTEVSVFPDDFGSGMDVPVQAESDGKRATFDALFPLPAGSDPYRFYMLSPSSAKVNVRGGSSRTVRVSVPGTQVPLPSSVDESAQLLVASSEAYAAAPSRVDFTPGHLSAYVKLTLTNVDPSLGTVGYVQLRSSGAALSGEADYDFGTGTVTAVETASADVTALTSSLKDVWLGVLPAAVSGTQLTVTVSGSKGSLSREVTVPPGKNFERGRIAVVTVDMKGAAPSGDATYGKVTDPKYLTTGSKVILSPASDGIGYAMSKVQNANERASVAVVKQGDAIVDPDERVEILTVEEGTASGTFALKTGDGKYLGAVSGTNYLTSQSKGPATDWKPTTVSGAQRYRNQGTTRDLAYTVSSRVFRAVAPTVSVREEVAFYKLAGTGDDSWKGDPELRLTKTSQTLTVGQTGLIGVGLCYSLVEGGVLSYESADPSVVTVDGGGHLTAQSAGETVVTVRVSETDHYRAGEAACRVTVVPPVAVTGVTLDKTELRLAPGESATLKATVSPSNAAEKHLYWGSSNTGCATVSPGEEWTTTREVTVTAVGVPGSSCDVVVITKDGNLSAKCKVTIKPKYTADDLVLKMCRQDDRGNVVLLDGPTEIRQGYGYLIKLSTKDGTDLPGNHHSFGVRTASLYQEYSNDVYTDGEQTWWRVAFTSGGGGWVSWVLKYDDDETDLHFEREVTLYVPKDLLLSKSADLSSAVSIGEEITLAKGESTKLYIMNVFHGAEAMDPDYLTLSATGDESVASLTLDADSKSFTIQALKTGKVTWNISYDKYGTRMSELYRQVTIEVVSSRYAIYYGSSEVSSTFRLTYDDVADNTYTFQLYDRIAGSYVYTTGGFEIRATGVNSSSRVSPVIDFSGASSAPTGVFSVYRVKFLSRVDYTYVCPVVFSYAGKEVKTVSFEVESPDYSFYYGSDYRSLSTFVWDSGMDFRLDKGSTLYFRLYDVTHKKFVSTVQSYATKSSLVSVTTEYLGAYMCVMKGAAGGTDQIWITATCSDGTVESILRPHVPFDLKFSTSFNRQEFIYDNHPIVGQVHRIYLWNNTENSLLYFNSEYLSVDIPSSSSVQFYLGDFNGRPCIEYVPVKSDILRTYTIRYDDGYGTTASISINLQPKSS